MGESRKPQAPSDEAFPSPEDVRNSVNLQTDVVLGMRLLLGWKPRWIIASYWAWLRTCNDRGSLWLRASGGFYSLFILFGLLAGVLLTLALLRGTTVGIASNVVIVGLEMISFVL